MFRLARRFPSALALLALAAPLGAEDFKPLTEATQQYFPEARRLGVVCDYRWSRAAVMDLARALGEDFHIVVVDLRHREAIGAAYTALLAKKPQMLVLMPHDPIVRDGSPHATFLISTLGPDIPSVGTRRVSLDNGAVLAVGPETHGVIEFRGIRFSKPELVVPPKQARQVRGTAGISVMSVSH